MNQQDVGEEEKDIEVQSSDLDEDTNEERAIEDLESSLDGDKDSEDLWACGE